MHDISLPAPGTLIIIGQPPAYLDDFCFSGQAERTIVVEPDPMLAAEAETRLGGAAEIQIITAAPWDGKPQAELKTFNFPGLRSLYSPNKRLKRLLPGLKECGRIAVESIALKTLTEKFVDLLSPVHVMIHLPGSECRIIDFWQKWGFLQEVDQLDILCCAEAFFHQGENVDEVQSVCAENAFDLVSRIDDDPDWPMLTFRACLEKRELVALRKEYSQLDIDLTATKAGLEEQFKAREAAQLQTAEAQGRADEAETALKEIDATLRTQKAELAEIKEKQQAAQVEAATAQERADEAEMALEELKVTLKAREDALSEAKVKEQAAQLEIATVQRRADEAEMALKEIDATLRTQEAELAEIKEKKQAAQVEAATAQERADEAEMTLEELKVNLKALEGALAEAKEQSETDSAIRSLIEQVQADSTKRTKELQSANEELSIALRMQSVLQADLSDLRSRFAESERQRLEQEKLLTKLTPRLQQAAEQLQYLSLPNEEPPAAEAFEGSKE
ncbi:MULTISPECIES: hypothetical protein [unclassified Sulfitobacter]|uniref:hypothetical protein n=1 Tax=unclassified Sulfitobacter TaxID=196795 RepID=UPI0037452644